MGFSWTTLTKNTTTLGKAQVKQVIDAVLSVETSLGIGSVGHTGQKGTKYSWETGYNPFTLEIVDDVQIDEIRAAVDNLDENNYCRAFNATNYNAELGGYLASVNSSNNGSR